jgi:Flp pilus assembly protein TadG
MAVKKLFLENKGSAIIETSVMFLLILTLVTGFIYLTNMVTTYSVIQTAAREGAREYSLTDNNSKAVNRAIYELKMGGVDADKAKITAKAEGQERRVTVAMDYTFFVPFIGSKELTLQSGATFRVVKYLR